MQIYPVIDYKGFFIVANPLQSGDRYLATFSVHGGDVGAGSVLQLPVVFQVGHSEAPSFGTAAEAVQDAADSAKAWIDAQYRSDRTAPH